MEIANKIDNETETVTVKINTKTVNNLYIYAKNNNLHTNTLINTILTDFTREHVENIDKITDYPKLTANGKLELLTEMVQTEEEKIQEMQKILQSIKREITREKLKTI